MRRIDPDENENALIGAIRGGDRRSFSQIVLKYREPVIRICRGYVGSFEDAEDLAQEIFVELYRSAGSFRGDSSVATWIYRIAINKSLNFVRDNRKKFSVFRSADSAGERVLYNSTGDNESDRDIMNSEHAKAIHLALDKLPANQKTAFILNKYEELSYKEISAIMKISHSSVESLIFRAKQNLQKSLLDYYQKNIDGTAR